MRKSRREDAIYAATVFLFFIIALIVLRYGGAGFLGGKVTVYIFLDQKCRKCGDFLDFMEREISGIEHNVRTYNTSSNPEARTFIQLMAKTGIQPIMPFTIVVRSNDVKAIVLGDCRGKSLWIMLGESTANTSAIIPVYMYCELVGIIQADQCLKKNLAEALDRGQPSLVEKRCGCLDNYRYIYIGAPTHKIKIPGD